MVAQRVRAESTRESYVDRTLEQRLARVESVAELADVVRTCARAAAGADGATFVLRERDRCFYVDEDSIAPLWKGQRFPLTSCISGWAMLHDRAVVIPDISVDERIPQEAYRPTFVRSLLMAPVGHGAAAAIGVYWAAEHSATADEQRRVLALADSAALVLDRIGLATAPWAPTFSER